MTKKRLNNSWKLLAAALAVFSMAVLSDAAHQKETAQAPVPAVAPESRYPVIPKPQRLEAVPGEFVFSRPANVYADDRCPEVGLAVDFLRERFGPSTDLTFPVTARELATILLVYDESLDSTEGRYMLEVSTDRIEIRAASGRGLFYGIQTLRQLLPAAVESRAKVEGVTWSVPCVKIEDGPRFRYRGLHLDVCRHFFPVAFIKKYIDLIAFHKMNYFHWHLTDDQGWRIEIKKYPLLTKIGAYRDRTLVGHGGRLPEIYDGQRYGGFYSRKEIREVVEYARKRFVTIVPEIEMPGHAQAALASYPELGCTGGPYKVADKWGVFPEVFCAGQEKTFRFIEDVLDEVCRLFPGPFVHIGGDECPKDRWKECPRCQARIKAEGLKDENELQSYFIRRVEKILAKRDRRLIGWDEILEGGLAPKATVMSWRGIQGGIEAARQKHDVIMTPNSNCYLDYYQAEASTQPLAIGGFLPMKKVYEYEPVPAELTGEEKKYILGTQGNVWTEYILNEKYVEYMAFPRACALAEVAWTEPSNKDWTGFLARLEVFYKHLEALDVNYFRGNRGALVESAAGK